MGVWRRLEIRNIASDLSAIKEENTRTNESITAVHAKIDKLSPIEGRITPAEENVLSLERSANCMARQIDELENRSVPRSTARHTTGPHIFSNFYSRISGEYKCGSPNVRR